MSIEQRRFETRESAIPVHYAMPTYLPSSPFLAHRSLTIYPALTPEERGKVLEETTLFAKAHIEAATTGQSDVPAPDHLDTNLHFTCFVIAPAPVTKEKRLIELDGRRAGPIDLGPCEQEELLGVSLV
jgi:ubiquitin carboxyl-terminal hydrolase L3